MTTADPRVDAIDVLFDGCARHDIESVKSAVSLDVIWWIPGHNPLSGLKEGVHEVVAYFDALTQCDIGTARLAVHAADDHVIDVYRAFSPSGSGSFDTTCSRFWTFNNDHQIDSVLTMCANQHDVDSFMWQNYNLAQLPERLNRFRSATQAPPDLTMLYNE